MDSYGNAHALLAYLNIGLAVPHNCVHIANLVGRLFQVGWLLRCFTAADCVSSCPLPGVPRSSLNWLRFAVASGPPPSKNPTRCNRVHSCYLRTSATRLVQKWGVTFALRRYRGKSRPETRVIRAPILFNSRRSQTAHAHLPMPEHAPGAS
jgi:hypothetical protein